MRNKPCGGGDPVPSRRARERRDGRVSMGNGAEGSAARDGERGELTVARASCPRDSRRVAGATLIRVVSRKFRALVSTCQGRLFFLRECSSFRFFLPLRLCGR